ncbi:conserved hypothetical protein [Hyella patelloides LEGE 07179]|uniref:Uncharacterized protein n=1 Tax=Hyella patelloides LEGE 07179 TaxID=945734 RepID=A0A563VWS7_9CYAN|nr:hypothetical protein [Hyella patelloides]VEP15847.1 conserved hypothetical protein [Hyella patelloides LEGE 07179]
MIYSTNRATTMQKIIQKFLLTITLAVFLITSFALSPQPALAGNKISKPHNRVHAHGQPRTTSRDRRDRERDRRRTSDTLDEIVRRGNQQRRNSQSSGSSNSSRNSRRST